MKSDLPMDDLKKIWDLADIDKVCLLSLRRCVQDGKFDAGEFAVAMYLINQRLQGTELPATLPADLIPPSKRDVHVL